MASDNHYTALGPGQNGFYTHAARLAYGVNVQGTTAGVYGEALAHSPGNRSTPSGSGVCGLGDTVGVIGQSLALVGLDAGGNIIPPGSQTPAASFLPPGLTSSSPPDQLEPAPIIPDGFGPGVGVAGSGSLVGALGTGYQFGVVGTCDYADKGGSFGTGVQGVSLQGVGVMGISQGEEGESGTEINPYIGVFGSAQSGDAPKNAYPIVNGDFDRIVASGVVGVGANYGGVFLANPELDPTAGVSPTFANVQLTPIPVHSAAPGSSVTPYASRPPSAPLPWLPLAGQRGDIVAVVREGATQLWVCLVPAPADNSQGTTWARVSFDYVCITPPAP